MLEEKRVSWVPTRQICSVFNVNSRNLLQWAKNGIVPAQKLGKGWLFDFFAFQRLINSGELAKEIRKYNLKESGYEE